MSQTDINSNVQTLFSIQMQDIKKKNLSRCIHLLSYGGALSASVEFCRGALSCAELLHNSNITQAGTLQEPHSASSADT